MSAPVVEFRFDTEEHEYVELASGDVRPHITGLLLESGWVDDRWFTEESSARGTAVHQLTADFDLGALDPATCVSPYRGWLLSHVAAIEMIRPEMQAVEVPWMHPTYKFGGRPDREARLWKLLSVLEGKSGPPARSHQIQTALQAILVAPKYSLPAHAIGRYALYWKANGKFALEEHKDRRDLDEALRIVKRYC